MIRDCHIYIFRNNHGKPESIKNVRKHLKISWNIKELTYPSQMAFLRLPVPKECTEQPSPAQRNITVGNIATYCQLSQYVATVGY